jgi:hypothetical protein
MTQQSTSKLSCGKLETHSWSAWNNLMPGSEGINVLGKTTLPSLGWQVSLAENIPQGINPAILLLTLKVVRPTGEAGTQMVPHDIVFKKPGAQNKYTSVQILCSEGGSISIDVQSASR